MQFRLPTPTYPLNEVEDRSHENPKGKDGEAFRRKVNESGRVQEGIVGASTHTHNFIKRILRRMCDGSAETCQEYREDGECCKCLDLPGVTHYSLPRQTDSHRRPQAGQKDASTVISPNYVCIPTSSTTSSAS